MKKSEIKSKKLELLKNKLLKEDQLALNEFINDLKISGTPIIEDVNDEEFMLLTFVYLADESIKDISIISDVIGGEVFGEVGQKTNLEELLDTNLYYASYLVKNDARSLYLFGINHNGEWFEDLILDPLNDKLYHCPKDPKDPERRILLKDVESVFEMPFAKSKDYIEPAKNEGSIEEYHLKSDILSNERRVWLYKPYGFDPNKIYGLSIFTDGFEYLYMVKTKEIVDNLIERKEIQPICVVFIENTDERDQELSENESYKHFIFDEVIPFIKDKIHISNNPKDNIFAGLSLGGLFASYIALDQYHIFGNILCQSPAYWYNNPTIIEKYQSVSTLPVKFYICHGYYEKTYVEFYRELKRFINVLNDKGIPYYETEYTGAHIYTDWQDTLPEAFKYLLNE